MSKLATSIELILTLALFILMSGVDGPDWIACLVGSGICTGVIALVYVIDTIIFDGGDYIWHTEK